MGDNKISPRLLRAIRDAEDAFFDVLAKALPECRTGNLSPDADIPFRKACNAVGAAWYDENRPSGVSSAKCDMVVELRPPQTGERGWWVMATCNAEEALAEVLRESEDMGWTCGQDMTAAQEFDDQGMRAVTIKFVRPGSALPSTSFGSPRPIASFDGDAFVRRLATHNEWSATWEYPGYVCWGRAADRVEVFATPDKSGEIRFDIMSDASNDARSDLEVKDTPWDRTAASYMAIVGPVLDMVSEKHQASVRVEGETATDKAILATWKNLEDL